MWWNRWPNANVAIRTGAPSGLAIIDIDPDHGGNSSLGNLIDQYGDFFLGSRIIQTGSGGIHLYFRHPESTVKNDNGRALGVGIDIRGDGGYVIAPPSLHTSGRRYTVDVNPPALRVLPDWVMQRMTQERPADVKRPPCLAPMNGRPPKRWAEAALTGELDRLRHAPEGTRNDTLNRIAFRLGQIVAGGGLEEAVVESTLVDGARAIGLGEREAQRTVRSGLRAGEQHPRHAQRAADIDVALG